MGLRRRTEIEEMAYAHRVDARAQSRRESDLHRILTRRGWRDRNGAKQDSRGGIAEILPADHDRGTGPDELRRHRLDDRLAQRCDTDRATRDGQARRWFRITLNQHD